MDKECIVCGHPYPEEHHIVFRGQQSAMIRSPLNKLNLCYEHHRGNNGPHMSRKIDLKYKMQLQERLKYLFSCKSCFDEDEIKDILGISIKEVRKLTKQLRISVIDDDVGYEAEEIIMQCLGGKMY